jgi:hypothetical protein
MATVTSLWLRFRMALAKRIDVQPPMGEAWCINCSLNDHQISMFRANQVRAHIGLHEKNEYLQIRVMLLPEHKLEDSGLS